MWARNFSFCGSYSFSYLTGRLAKFLLEDGGEVRHVFEANVETDVRHSTTAIEQFVGSLKPTGCEPTFGRKLAHELEVALEGRKAATRGPRKLAHGHITAKVLFHEVLQVDFFVVDRCWHNVGFGSLNGVLKRLSMVRVSHLALQR